MYKTIFLFITLTCLCVGEKLRFDNYSLYRIVPENIEHIKLLQTLQNDTNLQFWSDPVPNADFVSVMAPPAYKKELESILTLNEMQFRVTIENIQEELKKETIRNYTRGNFRSMTWDAYYPLDDIESFLQDAIVLYPGIVTPLIGGQTYEGREIKGIKISHGDGRKKIFIEAGIHSREWIVVSTACYIINQLLTSTDAATVVAARDYDWYIFPVTNPDGYVFTFEENRFWRKNRRPFGADFGVDLNRNWNNNWLVEGASTNPATESYAGPGPFSEPESRTLSTFIRSIGDIDMYLSFHSFSQLLMLPFGNSTEPYANYYDAMNIGRRAMGALSVRYGTQYVTGNIAEAIYHATGGSVDWVKEQLKVPLVYCYELRDRGVFGFLLPTDQILPNNEEVMDSLLDLIYQAERFGYLNNAYSIKVSFIVMISSLIAILW